MLVINSNFGSFTISGGQFFHLRPFNPEFENVFLALDG